MINKNCFISSNSFNGDGLNFYCNLEENGISCIEFIMEFQSNQIIYQKEYTKRQQVIYSLIQLLREEAMQQGKISKKLIIISSNFKVD